MYGSFKVDSRPGVNRVSLCRNARRRPKQLPNVSESRCQKPWTVRLRPSTRSGRIDRMLVVLVLLSANQASSASVEVVFMIC